MKKNLTSIVERQVFRWNTEKEILKEDSLQAAAKPVITISRLLGADGAAIAQEIARRLDCELIGIKIIDEIVKRSDVRRELIDSFDERMRNQIANWIDSAIGGKNFDDNDHSKYLLESLRYFTQMGSVVLLGRGAGFIPTTRPRINIRVIAPMRTRITRVMERMNCGREEAVGTINASDEKRTKFIKRLFSEDWSDPLNYDLVINTGMVTVSAAVSSIEAMWLRHIAGYTHRAEDI